MNNVDPATGKVGRRDAAPADGPPCCSPDAATAGTSQPAPPITRQPSHKLLSDVQASLVRLKGGFFEMGGRTSCYAADLDGPPRRVAVSAFQIGRTTVTNRLFAGFVAETGYVTTAQREGWSFVFHLFLADARKHVVSPPHTPWWRQVADAAWDHPEGPRSTIADRLDHPVVHVSWDDAKAFCDYTGTRLPHEAEWEFAARGTRKHARFPWGNVATRNGAHLHNVWQGNFPLHNSADDGFAGTAPADAFAPNDHGLYNMTGNVWEWCEDWFGPLPQAGRRPPRDPVGAETGTRRVMRGGSHLCHPSYCERYYVHSRTHNTPESSTGNIGFRLAG